MRGRSPFCKWHVLDYRAVGGISVFNLIKALEKSGLFAISVQLDRRAIGKGHHATSEEARGRRLIPET